MPDPTLAASRSDASGTADARSAAGTSPPIGVNQVIGGAVFALPAAVAANTGTWSPWLVAATGGLSLLIALCFAEVASRFEGTGGPYLYTRAAFGRFAAFEVGWLMWFTRAASWASVINVLVTSLAFYWPAMSRSGPRAAVMTAIIGAIAAINVRGIRQSSVVLNALTIAKLTPLVIFIAAGLFAIDPARLIGGPTPTLARALDDGAAADLRVRRLRGRAGACRRGPRSAPGGTVRAGHDDRDRHRW